MDVQVDDAPGTTHSDAVVLTLPARGAYLSILRTATAGLAARLQFTLDEIEDLRIAVDEACAMLLAARASDRAELTCRFTVYTDSIDVAVSTAGDTLPSRDTFAWQVLVSLADHVDTHAEHGELIIALRKQHRGGAS